MLFIKLDVSNWIAVSDYWRDLRNALGAPEGYAGSIDGMLELMVWDYALPDMRQWHDKHDQPNAPRPPYTVQIHNTQNLTKDLRTEIELLIRLIAEARKELIERDGDDVDVNLEIVSLH